MFSNHKIIKLSNMFVISYLNVLPLELYCQLEQGMFVLSPENQSMRIGQKVHLAS